MKVAANFYSILGALLLECAYSGPGPDGKWVQGVPPKDGAGLRLYSVPDAAESDVANYLSHVQHFPGFFRAFEMYRDMDSSYLMTQLVAHRILGPSRVRLPMTTESYEADMCRYADPHLVRTHTHKVNFHGMVLNLYDTAPAGIPLRVHTTRSALTAHFFLQQYALRREGQPHITVEPGDTVIDGGMCYGDTSLFFAHLAGEKGRVVGYEFEPGNLAVLADNLAMNPDIAQRVAVRHNAIWNVSNEEKRFLMAGPATVMLGPGHEPKNPGDVMAVTTLTIDDLVARENLDRVDFIKLDVEGVELAALHGAVNTLRRWKPKLALSAYHRVEDVYALPAFLDSLNLGYVYWLDHFRPHGQETVLFASCSNDA